MPRKVYVVKEFRTDLGLGSWMVREFDVTVILLASVSGCNASSASVSFARPVSSPRITTSSRIGRTCFTKWSGIQKKHSGRTRDDRQINSSYPTPLHFPFKLVRPPGEMSKKAKRILMMLNDPNNRKRLLESLNKDTMDAAAPVGNGEMTILRDVESSDAEHDQCMQDLKSGSHLE